MTLRNRENIYAEIELAKKEKTGVVAEHIEDDLMRLGKDVTALDLAVKSAFDECSTVLNETEALSNLLTSGKSYYEKKLE